MYDTLDKAVEIAQRQANVWQVPMWVFDRGDGFSVSAKGTSPLAVDGETMAVPVREITPLLK